MKRLLLSAVGGFGIPFLYGIVAGSFSPFIGNDSLNFLFWIPIGWPRILYFHSLRSFSNGAPSIEDSSLFVIMILCNVVLYGCITYIFLFFRSFRKPKAKVELPPPPSFLGALMLG